MQEPEIARFYPSSVDEWRMWLAENHLSKTAVWLVFYTKASGKPTISWREAVDAALCFGWIDSKRVAVNKEESHQFFSRRKAKSTWSKINKEKVAALMDAGLMAKAGLDSIELAKQNGSWTILDEVEELIIPKDLEEAFKARQGARDFFLSLSKSARKALLQWLVLAKRPETRQKRVDEIVEAAANNLKPKPF